MPCFGIKKLLDRENGSKPILKRAKRPEYRDRDAQPRLPTNRPRALTLPLPSKPGADTITQWTSPQSTNLLMRLPLELRLRIYEVVLGHRKVHVVFEFGPREYHTFKNRQIKKDVLEWRWWHTVCTWDETEETLWKGNFYDNCRWERSFGMRALQDGLKGTLKLEFNLLLTCRKVYSEAVDILYATTTFNFASHQLLRSFPSLILPHRFAAITSVEQSWLFANLGVDNPPAADMKLYNDMWAMVAGMPNLRNLKIAVAAYHCPKPVPANLQKTWLGPLEQMKGKRMEVFEIQVPESYARHFNICEDPYYKLDTFSDVNIDGCTLCTMGGV